MILTILGVIVITLPFLAVFTRNDRKTAFFKILGISVAFHILLAFITQALHIFSYSVVLSSNIVFAILLLFFAVKFRETWDFKIKINWFVIIAFVIICAELLSIHYLYTGDVQTVLGVERVENQSYDYPFYSDEWIGVAMADYSIESQNLPLVNPLNDNRSFKNPLAVFHATLAGYFLVLNLTPLTSWAIFAVIAGLAMCFLIYHVMRKLGVSPMASTIATLSISFITNGVNLPGIWFLIPYILGLHLFLLSYILYKNRCNKLSGLMVFLSLVMYPPLIVFIFPAILVYGYIKFKETRSWKVPITVLTILAGPFLIVFLFITSKFGFSRTLEITTSLLIRDSLTGGIPKLGIQNIIPIYLIPFMIWGVWTVIKKRVYIISVSIITGLFFWSVYSFYMPVILIEYSRVVVITSLLLIIIAGMGLDLFIKEISKLYTFIRKESKFHKEKITFSILILFLFIFLASRYTSFNNWSELKLVIKNDNNQAILVSPAAHTNRYLKEDDLDLFKDIENKRFLSIPWKGLILGTVTNNIPLESKPSTVSNHFLSYKEFLVGDCEKKSQLSKKYKIDYIYLNEINCPGFNKVGQSEEGLVLYEFVD